MFPKAKLKAIEWQNVLYTVLCNFNHIVYGIILHIFGGTLTDLQRIYSVSVDTIAYVPMAFTAGYMVGALIGWIYKWLNRQLIVSAFFVAMSLTAALTPYYPNFALLLVCIFVCGLGAGCWISSSGSWLVEMWPSANSAVLQFYQFMYGIGAVLSPLLVTPYVYGAIEFDQRTNRTISVDDRVRSLTTPYAICGVTGLIVPLIFVLLYFVRPYRKRDELHDKSKIAETNGGAKANAEEDNSDNDTRKHTPNRICKLAICGLALSCISTAEFGWFSFASALFQNLPISLSASSGAQMMAIFYATYTVGPLLTGFVALKLSPDIILSYHFVIMSGSLAALYIGRGSWTIIYAANGVFGFAYSAMWSGMFAFAERHLRLSDRICSTFSFLSGMMSAIIPVILGQTFASAPQTLFALEAGFITACIALFAFVRLWIWLDRPAAKKDCFNYD